jgi:hypothetical protein
VGQPTLGRILSLCPLEVGAAGTATSNHARCPNNGEFWGWLLKECEVAQADAQTELGTPSALGVPAPSRTPHVNVGSADNTGRKRVDEHPQAKTLLFFEGIEGSDLGLIGLVHARPCLEGHNFCPGARRISERCCLTPQTRMVS